MIWIVISQDFTCYIVQNIFTKKINLPTSTVWLIAQVIVQLCFAHKSRLT